MRSDIVYELWFWIVLAIPCTSISLGIFLYVMAFKKLKRFALEFKEVASIEEPKKKKWLIRFISLSPLATIIIAFLIFLGIPAYGGPSSDGGNGFILLFALLLGIVFGPLLVGIVSFFYVIRFVLKRKALLKL